MLSDAAGEAPQMGRRSSSSYSGLCFTSLSGVGHTVKAAEPFRAQQTADVKYVMPVKRGRAVSLALV